MYKAEAEQILVCFFIEKIPGIIAFLYEMCIMKATDDKPQYLYIGNVKKNYNNKFTQLQISQVTHQPIPIMHLCVYLAALEESTVNIPQVLTS